MSHFGSSHFSQTLHCFVIPGKTICDGSQGMERRRNTGQMVRSHVVPTAVRSMVAKSGHETQCRPWFERSTESTSAQEHVDRAENRVVENYIQTCVHQLDRRTSSWMNRSRRLQPGRQSKYWAHEHRQRRERSFGKLARASWCVAERICRLRSKEAWGVTPIAGHKNMVIWIAVKF